MPTDNGEKTPGGGFAREGRTREEFLANCAKGGRKSGETRRRHRLFRELTKELLDSKLCDEDEFAQLLEAKGLDTTEGMAVLYAQLVEAKKGSTAAAQFLRDTSGQKPADSLAVGNLDDRPFETLELNSLSDAELKAMVLGRDDGAEG